MRKSAGLAAAAASAAWLFCSERRLGAGVAFPPRRGDHRRRASRDPRQQLTATQLVQHYFKRIEAYNGTCVKGGVDAVTGLMLGEITPVENAGQLNAYMTLNIRGKRSKTDTRG